MNTTTLTNGNGRNFRQLFGTILEKTAHADTGLQQVCDRSWKTRKSE